MIWKPQNSSILEVKPNFSPNNMHCLWCTRRILLTRCPPNILQCKYHSDLIDMRASRIYVEICYSIEIDISIGLYQTGLTGIPATMYSVAKTKYMLNTNWCLIGFLTKLIISSLIEDGLLVPAFSLSKLEVVTSMKGEGGQKERNPPRTGRRATTNEKQDVDPSDGWSAHGRTTRS